jgi:threonine aldolase
MDGARFANAVAALGCSPAEITWKAGVDALSFGLTKNGAFMAEAVVLFDPAGAEAVTWRRKRAGHVVSKARFMAAQFLAMIEDGHWLALAEHANAMAKRLSGGMVAAGHRLAWPAEANEVFPIVPKALVERLQKAGAQFYDWPAQNGLIGDRVGPDEMLLRLVASFATKPEDVEHFLAAVQAG